MHRNYPCNYYKYNHQDPRCKIKITELRIIHEPYDIDEAINELYKRCKHFPVVGMDCEWIPTTRKNQQPDVSLLQIATVDGFCVLIRTCYIAELPSSLLHFLSDRKIVKVGVGILNDGRVLHHKFHNCQVFGKLDVRYLSRCCNVYSRSESLKELTKSLLSFELDKGNVLYYKWNSYELDEETARYAALDALAGVKIFEALLPLYHHQMSDDPFLNYQPYLRKSIERYFINPATCCSHVIDKKFK